MASLAAGTRELTGNLKLNGHAVGGEAILEPGGASGRKGIWAALTVPWDSPAYAVARGAVLANVFEVTLTGEAHDPLNETAFLFTAAGQLVNGRVGSSIKADFKSTTFSRLTPEPG